MTDFYFSLQQKFSNITKTKLVSQAPEHGEQHDVCRKLEIVEQCAGSFIEVPCAVPADEGSTASKVRCFAPDMDVDRQCGQDTSRSPRLMRDDAIPPRC